MSWILITILAYFFFSIVSFGDKLILSRAQNPRLYTFYVGTLSLLVLLLVPFTGISLPNASSFFWIILTSLVFISGLYVLYAAVQMFEVSRVVPLAGAVQPIFTLILSWIFFSFNLRELNIPAFTFLLLGGIIISLGKKLNATKNLIKISLFASLLVSLSFILTKMVFLGQTFFNGIIWIGIFNFLFVLTFIFDKGFRSEVFSKKSAVDKKTLSLVVLTQSLGGLAGLMQNAAIYLAPSWSLSIINALRGVQYVFLFAITLIFSVFLPKIIKEDTSRKVIIQKVLSVVLIVIGLAFLFLK